MSLFADPRADDDRSSALISRQPVVDRNLRVTGYRIAYAPLDGADLEAADDLTATRLFADVLGAVGLAELVGEHPAHLPVSRRLLLALGVPPVRPDRVVLRVAYAAAVDPALDEVLTAICRRGYAMSLHGLPGTHFDLDLLRRYGTVEVDCNESDWEQAGFAAARVQEYRAVPMAVELAGHTEFELARSIGFELFAGSFYASPRMTELRSVPVGSLQTLVSLARLRSDDAAVEELEEVIDRDIGLSVKLLRYINSAYFGVRSKVGSIRQAVMLLGSRGICRWALMVALAGGPSAPRELSVMALTRARMCELLGAPRGEIEQDELFTIGLLSLADALLDLPMEQVLGELPLADEIAVALLQREGPAGSILDAVISYEQGVFTAPSLHAHRAAVGRAYIQALGWAQETLAQVG